MNPLVSIIIPTYNRAHLLGATLNSILGQTYSYWECLVIDDGSSDATSVLMADYMTKDKRFRYYLRPDHLPKGANACRNYGFELSKGDYINWFDSDDVMQPTKLELQLEALELHDKSPYCICQTAWLEKDTETFIGLRSKHITSEHRMEDYVLYLIFWSILAPLWRRDFIETHGLQFDETLQQSQEYDFHIKALAINSNYVIIDEVLASMYNHEGNLSHSLYSDDLKLASNLKVKSRIVDHYLRGFTAAGQFKFLEILTLFYKDLLSYKKLRIAKQVLPLIFKTLKPMDMGFGKKALFCLRLWLAYISYVLIGHGYRIVKPIRIDNS